MQWKHITTTCLVTLSSITTAEYLPADHYLWGPKGSAAATLVQKRATATPVAVKAADPVCTNSPLTRQCWSNGYSVATDYDEKWPETGKTVSYNFELTNGTCNPDGGRARPCQLFNKQYPGPLITANWGDIVKITVKNSLQGNGTSVHWHGIRQLNTVTQDGVNGITECPLAPGDTKTYTWKATQFGTTWYHSHYSAQYGEGATGPIVIHGPASANYDVDLGPMVVSDWYYQTAFQTEEISDQNLQRASPPPPADTILINGTNKNANGGGKYAVTSITKGKKYRLRLINTSMDNTIRVSLDNHRFQVITSDLTPIKPYSADWILLTVGQRYDVIFTANQTVGNYWFRAVAATDCASGNRYVGNSIFRYADAPVADPQSTAVAAPTVCQDERNLVPWVPNTVPRENFAAEVGNLQVDLTRTQLTTNNQSIVVWGVNLTAIDVAWEQPTLQYVLDKNASYPRTYNLIEIPNQRQWVFRHLHGHDFYVLGQGQGVFNTQNIDSLKFQNPDRRDTAILPAAGWLAIAFETDNPGAWLLHCHIAWHISAGLGVQFLESKDQINLPDSAWSRTCDNWDKYWENPLYEKQDSGLKMRM